MKLDQRMRTAVGVLILLAAITVSLPAFETGLRAEGIAGLTWKIQGLQSWGRKGLAVDFGARGLWNYNGVWVQLSRLDPQHMTGWGSENLAIDFGSHGLWIYDGRSWTKITL